MTQTSNDDVFRSWTGAQQRLWDELSQALPAFRPPADLDFRRDVYLRHLTAWESVVEQSLTVQKTWLEEWAAGVLNRNDTPEAVTEWARQVEEVMQHWLQAQSELWQNWFGLLRKPDQLIPKTVLRPTPPTAAEAPAQPVVTAAAEPPAAQPAAEPVVAPTPAAAVPVATTSVIEIDTALVVTAPVVAATPAVATTPDDLKLLKGIGPALEKKLHAAGITRFQQIATLSAADITRLENDVLKFAGRIQRDNWIEQAKALHQQKYQEQL